MGCAATDDVSRRTHVGPAARRVAGFMRVLRVPALLVTHGLPPLWMTAGERVHPGGARGPTTPTETHVSPDSRECASAGALTPTQDCHFDASGMDGGVGGLT